MLKKGLLAVALVTAAAGAQADENRGFEFGLGLSRNDYQLDEELFGAGFKDSDTGFSGFVGYRFFPQLAVEVNYLEGGKAEWSGAGVNLKLRTKAYGASVLGSLPLGQSFALFARAGYLRGELDTRLTIDGDVFGGDTTDNKPFYGAGIRAMLDGAQVRLEYNRADFDIIDTEIYLLSVAWLL